MTRNYFRPIQIPREIERASDQVEKWGYPRTIKCFEWDHGIWYGWGDEAIFWYLAESGFPGAYVEVHVCFSPDIQGRIYTRRFIQGLEIIAESLGARYLRACDTVDGGKVSEYLDRMGWKLGDDGWHELDLWRREDG